MGKFLICFNLIFVQWYWDTFPKVLHGNEVHSFFWPFSKRFFFCYDDRDHHQDEISELCPMTIDTPCIQSCLSACSTHLGAKHTHPTLLQAEPQVLSLYHSLLNTKHVIKTKVLYHSNLWSWDTGRMLGLLACCSGRWCWTTVSMALRRLFTLRLF